MTDRKVRLVLRDDRGAISYLLGSWGIASAVDAQSDLSSGRHRYVLDAGGERIDLTRCQANDGRSLIAVDARSGVDLLDQFPIQRPTRSRNS